jgi:VWFA-related protein
MKAAALALVLGLTPQADAQELPPRLVHIHVTATDADGRSIEDLDAGELRIVESDAVRPIESIRLVRASRAGAAGESFAPIDTVSDERAEASREGTRVVGIFLDEYHVTSGAPAELVRHALDTFVTEHLGPRDLVVIIKPLDSLLRIRATRDLNAVREAIRAFEGRKGVLEPQNEFERKFIAASPATVQAVRAQISTSVLHATVRHLGQISDGRKALVVASEGFASTSPRRGEPLPTPAAIVRLAGRTGVAVHVLDPRDGAAADPQEASSPAQPRPGREMLQMLAERTNGIAMFGPDAWRRGWRQIDAELSHYYVVGFQSGARADGRFHELAVSITRPAVTVRAPRGHWSDSAADRVPAVTAPATPAAAALPVLRTSGLIRPWFGVSRAADGLARVSFVWEAVGPLPGERLRQSLPARVTLRASMPDGVTVFEGVVTPVDAASAGTSLAAFDVPEGRVRLEMRIEDGDRRQLDVDVRDLAVEAPAEPLAFGTAAVFSARTARELRGLREDARAVPVASRTFSRSQRLLLRVPVYAQGEPQILATLVSVAGRPMRESVVMPSGSNEHHEVEIPLAGLPAGQYRLEIRAEHEGHVAAQAIDIRVVP